MAGKNSRTQKPEIGKEPSGTGSIAPATSSREGAGDADVPGISAAGNPALSPAAENPAAKTRKKAVKSVIAGASSRTVTRKSVSSRKTAISRESAGTKTGAGKKKPDSTSARQGTLVIVESPAKARTIEKYLGAKFSVLASMGHLIDLPKSRLGVDVDHDFDPEYMTIRGRASILKDLQKAAKKSKNVYLASDPDREGEAIAYQIGKYLQEKIPDLPCERIVFNEITPAAIKEAVRHPRAVDMPKVDAQKARRVLDRLVGYNLSPLLWKKVKNGLSAGRVQSVALRLICDREKEVESFIPQEFWTLDAKLRKGRTAFAAELVQVAGAKIQLGRESQALELIASLEGNEARVAEIRETERVVRPKAPFTTSTLQQLAATRLGYTSKKTMQLAQQLYEGVNLGSTRIGLITYMRTDSTRISSLALDEARAFISSRFPGALPEAPQIYAADGKSQDAHEAIRPTTLSYVPDEIKEQLGRDLYRLYALIWERFLASQMKSALMAVTTADIAIGDALFRCSTSRFLDRGFLAITKTLAPKEIKDAHSAPVLVPGELLTLEGFSPEQHFTQGPSRFTDASIIKAMEELGIGRPSTYAPTISVLLERYYVTRETRQLTPTTLGRMINDILVESFPEVVNTGFTADMETRLDEVDEARADWVQVLSEFYGPFKQKVDIIMASLSSYRGSLDEPTDVLCDKCGKPMVKKLGRFGFFLACTGFPDCRTTKSIPLATCPKCGGDVVARRTVKGKGREFYGCDRYPECDFLTYDKPTGKKCPGCSWPLVEKNDRRSGARHLCSNPDCTFIPDPVQDAASLSGTDMTTNDSFPGEQDGIDD